MPTPRPIKPVDYLILVSLSDRERHGYDILQDLRESSGGEVVLDAGNLYRSIRSLSSRSEHTTSRACR